ncbi:MAG TPA: T9SS type A sorting domain-containing protein [Chitinophagaceae bacterium]|nr:T9SS type A sorting domain-containing protein [Chitinophagaceae bacterium]
MKKIFILCVFAFAAIFSKAQVVLNEVYPEPGATYQEFFELYNTSTNPVPESLDNYTLIAYYEEPGGKSGFYVLDLPNQTVNAKGYYVGSSLSTFAIQGQSGLSADLNWNSIPAGGALTKWEKSGSSYTSVSVPANLNDLFVKITGGGGGSAAFEVFVYKNGILVNGIMGGSNANAIPSSLKAMPDLFVDMTGSSPDFTIKFSTISDNSVEYISGTAGTNNGYYRQYDGKCGVWKLSSSAADYTPGQSNGSAAATLGTLTISATISSYVADPTKSLLTYNITAGPADAFPVVVEVYQDLGIIGELDASDVLVDSKNIGSSATGSQNVIMPTNYDGAILVAKSPAGCYDRVIALPALQAKSTLPIHLISFQGNMNKSNKVTLNWTVADNEIANNFEVERSFNGRDFTTVALVFASEKMGTENYMYYETTSGTDKVMYRLKMTDKNHEADYSRILIFQLKSAITNNIKIIGNPVNDKLTFSYTASATQVVDVKVYDMTGRMVLKSKVNSLEGSNVISLPLNSTFKAGMYVVEVNNGTELQSSKFVKQ